MADLKAIFKLSPVLAIKHFRKKADALSWDWYELWQEAHKKTFTVAKVAREDILKDIRAALDKSLEKGETFQEFQKELKPILQKKGWWGEQFIGDSKGNIEKVQLGSMYRLKTIYAVNMQTAYQTGRYKTQIENADNRPFWEYVSVLDQRTRPEHAQLNGLVFRCDDPFWDSFYPPNGWRCRCRVRALSDYNIKDRKLTVENSEGRLSEEQQLISKKSGEYAPVTAYTDSLTGKKITPDVGWSYNAARA